MFNVTKILRFPLRSLSYLNETTYAKSPEKREAAMKTVRSWYEKNETAMEHRGIERLVIA